MLVPCLKLHKSLIIWTNTSIKASLAWALRKSSQQDRKCSTTERTQFPKVFVSILFTLRADQSSRNCHFDTRIDHSRNFAKIRIFPKILIEQLSIRARQLLHLASIQERVAGCPLLVGLPAVRRASSYGQPSFSIRSYCWCWPSSQHAGWITLEVGISDQRLVNSTFIVSVIRTPPLLR